ncbi:unnamed protein product [Lactuca saligna]|uniref:26S proteasome regulatory subunit Rpn7 N-terminal domain-containing protein n=1 Tax=Lactuca saligna TaxID=75948 RepID=A0AA35YNQ3_LACSI|nr:unnamed protein product [Lactuca saligna]
MASLHKTLVVNSMLEVDQKVLDSMRARIAEELKKLDEKIADAEENLGESEVREAHLAKYLFYSRIGEKEKALQQMNAIEGKTVDVGQRMDLEVTPGFGNGFQATPKTSTTIEIHKVYRRSDHLPSAHTCCIVSNVLAFVWQLGQAYST